MHGNVRATTVPTDIQLLLFFSGRSIALTFVPCNRSQLLELLLTYQIRFIAKFWFGKIVMYL